SPVMPSFPLPDAEITSPVPGFTPARLPLAPPSPPKSAAPPNRPSTHRGIVPPPPAPSIQVPSAAGASESTAVNVLGSDWPSSNNQCATGAAMAAPAVANAKPAVKTATLIICCDLIEISRVRKETACETTQDVKPH